LLALNSSSHVGKTLLHGGLTVFSGLYFFTEALLVLHCLLAHLLVMLFEVIVEQLELFLFCVSGLEVALHCLQSSLELLVFLAQLIDFHN